VGGGRGEWGGGGGGGASPTGRGASQPAAPAEAPGRMVGGGEV